MAGFTFNSLTCRNRTLTVSEDIVFNPDTPILPAYLAIGGSGGPTFQTFVLLCNSAREYRVRQWEVPVSSWTINTGGMKRETTQALRDFFINRGGRFTPFLFADPIDYFVRKQRIGTGDGHTRTFQAVRTYTISGYAYTRVLRHINCGNLAIYLNAVASNIGFIADPDTGIITFDSAPGNGVAITADLEFYSYVRFGADVMDVAATSCAWWDVANIALMEIREVYDLLAQPTLPTSIRFPDNLPYGCISTPLYSTMIAGSGGGWESRFAAFPAARRRWVLNLPNCRWGWLEPVIALFLLSGGRHGTFRLKDFADYVATDQYLGTGNGSNQIFQLVKNYAQGSTTIIRNLIRPVSGTVVVHTYSAGGVQDADPSVSVNYDTGKVTLTPAPTTGHVVRASCQFDCLARFDVDSLIISPSGPLTGQITNMNMVEVLES